MSAYVYRLFDKAGDLLYVGYTANSVATRLYGNRNLQKWGYQIASHTSEEFATPAEAHAAEGVAIRNEKPRYNIERTGEHRADRPARRLILSECGARDGDYLERLTYHLAQRVHERGLNDSQLTDLTGIPRMRLRRHLSHVGRCSMPDLYRITKALDVSLFDLMEAAA